MVLRLPEGYVFDPEDPRSPTEEIWARSTSEQRAAVLAMLPSALPFELAPSEGDPHTRAIIAARLTLSAFFRRVGRKIYVSSNLAVYYPGEPRFAPGVLAVRDVEPHDRKSWAVVTERKGLDFVLDVHVAGDRQKDEQQNVERYARLGIPEYFVFNLGRRVLHGYRLPKAEKGGGRRAYQPIVPRAGRYPSEVLDLELMLEGDRLRFSYGMATVPEGDELFEKLETALGEALTEKGEAVQRADAEARLREEAERRVEAAERRAEEAERALAEAWAEIEGLRGGG